MCVVISGGPGFGKTSLITELEKLGYAVVKESSCELIHNLKEKEGKDPRNNRKRFQRLIEEKRIEDFMRNNQDIVFFDRGIHDELAYSWYYYKEPGCTQFCKDHKFDKVCIVPPWNKIHKNDELRKESYEEAIEIHKLIKKAYSEHSIIT